MLVLLLFYELEILLNVDQETVNKYTMMELSINISYNGESDTCINYLLLLYQLKPLWLVQFC